MEATDILMVNYNLFKKIKELSERQEEAIINNHMDEFNSLLNLRDQTQKEITENSHRYRSEINNASYKKEYQKSKKITKDILDTIRFIQEIDKRIEKYIIDKKDILANDIKNIRTGQNALKCYGRRSKKITKFLDRSG